MKNLLIDFTSTALSGAMVVGIISLAFLGAL